MAGPEGTRGKESEYFPIIVRTLLNRAGYIIIELLFSENLKTFYYMENPPGNLGPNSLKI